VTASKIDWHFWLGMRTMKAWQAISLSLGVDPTNIRCDPRSWKAWAEKDFSSNDHGSLNNRIKEEFGKRLLLLRGSRSDGSRFKYASLSMEDPAYHGVELNEVTKWLQSIGRVPVADELLKAVKNAPAPVAEDPPSPPAEMPWIQKARDAAQEFHRAKPKLTKETISNLLHDKLKKDGVVGRGGKVPSPETIRKSALAGMKF